MRGLFIIEAVGRQAAVEAVGAPGLADVAAVED